MLIFAKHNANFKNRKTCDCVIRAIAEASSIPYKDAAKRLFDEWMSTGYDMTSNKVVDKVLSDLGFVKKGKPFKENGKTYCAIEMDKLIGQTDAAVVQVASHLTCVKGQYLIDLWDCGVKSVYGYWIKKNAYTGFTDGNGKPVAVRIEL